MGPDSPPAGRLAAAQALRLRHSFKGFWIFRKSQKKMLRKLVSVAVGSQVLAPDRRLTTLNLCRAIIGAPPRLAWARVHGVCGRPLTESQRLGSPAIDVAGDGRGAYYK